MSANILIFNSCSVVIYIGEYPGLQETQPKYSRGWEHHVSNLISNNSGGGEEFFATFL